MADDAQAVQEWAHYVRACHAPATSRRVYSMTYEHERSLFDVRVGQPAQISVYEPERVDARLQLLYAATPYFLPAPHG